MVKKYVLTVTVDTVDGEDRMTINTECQGFNAFEQLGFLELKQQDLLNQLNNPHKFVRKAVDGGEMIEEATDDA